MARLTWHGHAAFSLVTDQGARVLFDPFLDGNPKCDVRAADITELDYILCSHGHSDHFSDVIPIAKRTGATDIGAYELTGFAESQGVSNAHGMSIGGGHHFDRLGYVKLTAALHGPGVDGADGKVSTMPCGFLLDMDGKRLYFAGDTALLMDMQLLRGRVDVALLPIGDNYTMGPEDAARAVSFIEPRVVIPMHYNTWELIAQDPHAFADRVDRLDAGTTGVKAKVHVLEPGESYDF
jgi:L-ascorbate metabolism protein UlaG (beta-lactamase superfamily)